MFDTVESVTDHRQIPEPSIFKQWRSLNCAKYVRFQGCWQIIFICDCTVLWQQISQWWVHCLEALGIHTHWHYLWVCAVTDQLMYSSWFYPHLVPCCSLQGCSPLQACHQLKSRQSGLNNTHSQNIYSVTVPQVNCSDSWFHHIVITNTFLLLGMQVQDPFPLHISPSLMSTISGSKYSAASLTLCTWVLLILYVLLTIVYSCWIVSLPGHSQILSRSCGEESGSGLGTRLVVGVFNIQRDPGSTLALAGCQFLQFYKNAH